MSEKPLNELFEEVREHLGYLKQTRETAQVTFDRLVADVCGKELATLEDIEDPTICKLLCQINLDEVHLSMLGKTLDGLFEIITRISCMCKEKEQP